MFVAIINVPGYLSEQDELPEFDDMSEAWRFLLDQRVSDLDDPMNDEAPEAHEDSACQEMEGMIESPRLGSVYGFTPGYDGDHDLGLAYSVVEVTYASDCVHSDDFVAWANTPGG